MLSTISSVFRHPNIADQINKGHYTVMMPQLYGDVPSYFLEHGVSPIYEFDPDTQGPMTRGTCTIAEMIDMYNNGYTFQILRDTDILDVYHIVDKYITALKRVDSVEPEVLVTIDKIDRFITGILPEYKCACRRLNIPDTSESFFGNLLSSMRR